MLEAVGHPVIALHRGRFGPLVLGSARGASRPLAEEEVTRLRGSRPNSGAGEGLVWPMFRRLPSI